MLQRGFDSKPSGSYEQHLDLLGVSNLCDSLEQIANNIGANQFLTKFQLLA